MIAKEIKIVINENDKIKNKVLRDITNFIQLSIEQFK